MKTVPSSLASIVISDDVDSLPSAEDILVAFRRRATMKTAQASVVAGLIIATLQMVEFWRSGELVELIAGLTWILAIVAFRAGHLWAKRDLTDRGAYAVLAGIVVIVAGSNFVSTSPSLTLAALCLGYPVLYLCALTLAPPTHARYWIRAMPVAFAANILLRQLLIPVDLLSDLVDLVGIAGGGAFGMVIVGHLADGLTRALRRSLALSETVRRGLERSQRQLVKHRDALESRVASRTKDLEAKNHSLGEAIRSLERTQEQLVQSEKMASLGLLVAGIAHEIKNPLNFVNNFSELAIEFIDEIEERRQAGETVDIVAIESTLADVAENLARIREHGRRADGIINAMLMHARDRHGEPVSVDFNEMVMEHVNLAYQGFRATNREFSMDIEKALDEGIGEVRIPYQEVARVVVNLVSNACHAMRERERSDADPDYRARLVIRTRGHAHAVELVVRDNGTGMTADVRRRVFDPFYTTKPPGEGTGLGLSLSYEVVVKELGGTLEVRSMTGEGAEFAVRVPVSGEDRTS